MLRGQSIAHPLPRRLRTAPRRPVDEAQEVVDLGGDLVAWARRNGVLLATVQTAARRRGLTDLAARLTAAMRRERCADAGRAA
ncbi:hypothetical protein [Cumulibacter soli]|uniref:hypothetical protein n=1 Tax=Cumulibacter soli TaxID=2546344 RepID=UPI001067BDB0|nr:hypothetical protein [Cumulibacter soli]